MLSLAAALVSAPPAVLDWTTLSAGVEYRTFEFAPGAAQGDGLLHVVRVDPKRALIQIFTQTQAGRRGGANPTAAEWREKTKMVAVINAGMFATDHRTHTGYLRVGEHINSGRWVDKYRSILLVGPSAPDVPYFTIVDAEPGQSASAFADYTIVSQNLRLIRGPGRNAWARSERRWSEAALALDESGRVLLLFSRSPLSMHDFNRRVLALPLKVTRAMHLEGGPEASLSFSGAGVARDLAGSYETGFNENDDNEAQWGLPNVLGVKSK